MKVYDKLKVKLKNDLMYNMTFYAFTAVLWPVATFNSDL